jgi:hypothetical protein
MAIVEGDTEPHGIRFIKMPVYLLDVQHVHSLLLFDVAHNPSYYTLYQQIAHYLSDGYAVVYVVESNPGQVAKKMADMYPEIESFIKSRALTVIDKNAFYLPEKMKFYGRPMLNAWSNLLSKIQESGNFKGFLVMGMLPEVFFETARNQKKLVDYEQSVANNFDNFAGIEAICCYTIECIDKLPLSYVLRLLNSHQRIVRPGLEQVWTPKKNVEIVERALNRFFPNETSHVVMSIIENVSTTDKKTAVTEPELFEESVRKLFDKSADIIFNTIKSEIKREILS